MKRTIYLLEFGTWHEQLGAPLWLPPLEIERRLALNNSEYAAKAAQSYVGSAQYPFHDHQAIMMHLANYGEVIVKGAGSVCKCVIISAVNFET